MLIRIAAIGRIKRGPLADLSEDYRSRLSAQGRSLGVTACDVKEGEAKRGLTGEALSLAEADILRGFIPNGACRIALDETGRSETSTAFATRLEGLLGHGKPLCFLIGGADGLHPSLRNEAEHLIALGPMTWPHMLARTLILEQLYRAVTILTNHPYHRA